jgi:quercetin dioxygenase-like cupin family protein
VRARVLEGRERPVVETGDGDRHVAGRDDPENGCALGGPHCDPVAQTVDSTPGRCRFPTVAERAQAVGTTLIDNDRVRVTRWQFETDAATGWHRHEYDYVIVPLTTGTLRLEEGDSAREAELTLGSPYFREAGVEHDVVNASGGDFAFVEVELKRAP